MEHFGTIDLETERLILRRFSMNDAKKMFCNWTSDDEVTKYLVWQTHKSINDTKTFIEECVQKYNHVDFYNWIIILKEINEPVGNIGVARQSDDIKMVHINYCLGKKWWNRGIMSEALNELIKFFFEKIGVNRIESRHDPNNPNSGKVMTKCGMKYEGYLRQADKNNQGITDTIYYGILAEDYFKDKDEKSS